MVFSIMNYNKSKNKYQICNDAGEQAITAAYNITAALANGSVFTNAYLTKKGFAITDGSRTTYVQLDAMPAELKVLVLNRLAYIKQVEDAQRQQAEFQRKQAARVSIKPTTTGGRPIATAKKKIGSASKTPVASTGKRIMYKGDVYLSDEQLCSRFGQSVDTFRKLRSQGYSMDESLGLIKPRPLQSVQNNRARVDKILDSAAMQRGDM